MHLQTTVTILQICDSMAEMHCTQWLMAALVMRWLHRKSSWCHLRHSSSKNSNKVFFTPQV